MIDVRDNAIVSRPYKFIGLFDARDCIPNMSSYGDPNMSGLHYFITQYALKHKGRNWLHAQGGKILHTDSDERTVLQRMGLDMKEASKKTEKELLEMELQYQDIRMFGTFDGANDGSKDSGGEKKKEKGIKICSNGKPAITIGEARTLDPVRIIETDGSRSFRVHIKEDGQNSGSNRYARWFLDYGLFYFYGSVDPVRAAKYGLTVQDLDDFFEALWHCFDDDASSLRPGGSMLMRCLAVYEATDDFLQKKETSMNIVYTQQLAKKIVGSGTPTGIGDYNIYRPKEYAGLKLYSRTMCELTD